MENRLKERLTGAAILVALIVLVVPALFHGQRDTLSAGANGTGDGPVSRSYVIDLKDSAAHVTAPPAAQPAAVPAATAAAATAPLATAPVAAPPVATAPVATAPVATATPPIPPRTQAPAAAAPEWSVQLGLFAQRENAQRLVQAAQSKGFAVSIAGADRAGADRAGADRAGADPGGPYRVHLTGFPDRAAAENVRVRLRAQGFDAALVGPQGREP